MNIRGYGFAHLTPLILSIGRLGHFLIREIKRLLTLYENPYSSTPTPEYVHPVELKGEKSLKIYIQLTDLIFKVSGKFYNNKRKH